MNRILPVACALAILAGCPEPEPEPDPEPDPLMETVVSGVLVDRDSGEALADCEVGVERTDAVLSDSSGEFELTVGLGAIVHVLCEETPLHSFAVPELETIDWTVRINRETGPDPASSCSPTLAMDATALDADNGGHVELRYLSAVGTMSWTSIFWQSTTTPNLFIIPEGDYKLLAHAYGGTEGGFGLSAPQSCAGDGSSPTIDVEVTPLTLRQIQGTWSGAAAGAEFEVNAYQQLEEGELDWWWQEVAHTSSGNPNGWSATVADGIGFGPLDLEACQTVNGSMACVSRVAVDDSGTVPLGELVAPESVVASLIADQRLSVSLPVEFSSGRMVLRVGRWVDVNTEVPIWRATSYDPSIAVPLEWLEDLLTDEPLTARVYALDGATFDFTEGYEPTAYPDGWMRWAPALADVIGN